MRDEAGRAPLVRAALSRPRLLRDRAPERSPVVLAAERARDAERRGGVPAEEDVLFQNSFMGALCV